MNKYQSLYEKSLTDFILILDTLKDEDKRQLIKFLDEKEEQIMLVYKNNVDKTLEQKNKWKKKFHDSYLFSFLNIFNKHLSEIEIDDLYMELYTKRINILKLNQQKSCEKILVMKKLTLLKIGKGDENNISEDITHYV